MPPVIRSGSFLFFFNDTPTPEIYTLSLHDALPICLPTEPQRPDRRSPLMSDRIGARKTDRKSTRLNSSHSSTSYAVFCLKKNRQPCCHARSNERSENSRAAACASESCCNGQFVKLMRHPVRYFALVAGRSSAVTLVPCATLCR